MQTYIPNIYLMAIYKYVKITLTVLKFLIYRKEFFGMRKFTLDAWNRHIANIQIEGYGQGLAKAKMMAMVHALRILSVYDGVLIG